MRLLRPTLLLALLVVLGACGGSETTPGAGGAPSAAPGDQAPNGSPATTDGAKATPGSEQPSEPVDDPAPEFEVETFEGDTFALAEQQGTPVVLNFWESW